MKFSKAITICFLLVITLLANCSYVYMSVRHTRLRISNALNPSISKAKVLNPDKNFTVYGQLKMRDPTHIPMVIAAISHNYNKQEIVSKYYLPGNGYFSLYLPEGTYSIIVLADKNNDSLFTESECIGYYNDAPYFTVDKSNAHFGIISGLILYTNPDKPFAISKELRLRYPLSLSSDTTVISPPGSIRQLNDTLFSQSTANIGIYDPDRFLSLSGIYFYTLRESSPDKIPVIFVHGYGGSPRDFEFITPIIDTSKYVIWFFYYPSGQSLEKTAAIFFEIFLSNRIITYKPQGITIIAHSMGGLVARRALNLLSQSNLRVPPIKFISLCTPYGGNEGADEGLKNAPVKIDSWKELASKSEFIKQLSTDQLDKNIKFHLIFGFRMESNNSESSDGTIVLKSQLHYPVQKIATSFTGFNETHKSILNSQDVFIKLKETIDN